MPSRNYALYILDNADGFVEILLDLGLVIGDDDNVNTVPDVFFYDWEAEGYPFSRIIEYLTNRYVR